MSTTTDNQQPPSTTTDNNDSHNDNSNSNEPEQKRQKLERDIASSLQQYTANSSPMRNGTYKTSNLIREGDLVIVHLKDDDLRPIYVKSGEKFQCAYGMFPHETFINVPYGSKVRSTGRSSQNASATSGFVHLLRPSPQLWTLGLAHRTQILYTADISLILNMLYLKPGSRVVESGTGSGSLSHAIARCVAPTGHLYTFEYHEPRFLEATKEFERNGFSDLVTTTHCDAYAQGFLHRVGQAHSIDAVFLDLPKPWLCISPHVNAVLKVNGGRFCSFSPCIEQIQKTADVLRQYQYVDIKVYEILQKGYTNSFVTELPKVDWEAMVESTTMENGGGAGENSNKRKKQEATKKVPKATLGTDRLFLPEREMRGHTGYLLFATRFYDVSDEQVAELLASHGARNQQQEQQQQTTESSEQP